MIVVEEMQGIAARSGEKKRGDLASKGLDPWLELVQALGPTKEARELGDPQKFSSQNEGLIAGAISPRTLRCRAALHTHVSVYVCVYVLHVCELVYVDRCSSRHPTCQPAR